MGSSRLEMDVCKSWKRRQTQQNISQCELFVVHACSLFCHLRAIPLREQQQNQNSLETL